jgi:hypothetical protein
MIIWFQGEVLYSPLGGKEKKLMGVNPTNFLMLRQNRLTNFINSCFCKIFHYRRFFCFCRCNFGVILSAKQKYSDLGLGCII